MHSRLIRSLTATVPARPSLDEVRAELAARGLEGWLWPWLTRMLILSVFGQLRSRYSAALYSPTGHWDDEGAWELAQDFIADQAIDHGVLAMALARAESVAGLQRYVEVSFHRYVIAERRRGIASNLFVRLQEVLASASALESLAGFGRRAAYGLRAWLADPPALADGEVVLVGHRFLPHDLQWTEFATGARQSPGLRSAELLRIATALMTATQRLWTADQILTVIQQRFDLSRGDPDAADGGEADLIRLPSAAPSALEAGIARELATSAVAALTSRQRQVLAIMVQESELRPREIAGRLGVSKSLVHNEQRAIQAVCMALPLTGPDEKAQVLAHMAEIGAVLDGEAPGQNELAR